MIKKDEYEMILNLLKIDPLMVNMNVVIKICEIGRKIRQQNKLKMRQPLKKAFVYISDMFVRSSFTEYFVNEIKEELNIKDIELLKEPKWYFDIDVKPNFKTLGKKLGKNMKSFQDFLKDNKEQIGTLHTFLIEPFVPHTREYYVAIKTERDHDVIYFSEE